ncbi:TPA: hypothetical protein QEL76_002842 [Stenotrophomonas maltophilia]|nr:hypothetical protein [Stenotrophomonas maltophilia]
MKMGFKPSVVVTAIALTLGIGSATAQPDRCRPCHDAYSDCLAAGKGEKVCYPAFVACMAKGNCGLP